MSFDRFSEGETFIVDYWFLKTYCGSFDQALINRKMFLPNDSLCFGKSFCIMCVLFAQHYQNTDQVQDFDAHSGKLKLSPL